MSYPIIRTSSGCSQEMVDSGSKAISDSHEKYKFEEKFAIFNACTDIKNTFNKKYWGKWNVVIYNENYGNSSIDAAIYLKYSFLEYEIKIFQTSEIN